MRKNNLAYICSPYRGNILEKVRNILYAKHLTKLALQLGYTPITTHLYLTQVLNDNNPTERRQGLKAGGNILNACDTIIIGARYGVSAGMAAEMDAAKEKYTIIVIYARLSKGEFRFMLEIRKAIAEIYLFLWELRIKIKIMPQAEFERMVGKLTAEQKAYAIYFRIF